MACSRIYKRVFGRITRRHPNWSLKHRKNVARAISYISKD